MEKVQKVELLLNGITEESKDELIKEFVSYDITSELEEIVTKILEYVCKKPDSCSICAEVCENQVKREMEIGQTSFSGALLNRAETRFCSIIESYRWSEPPPTENHPYFLIFLAKLFIKNIIPTFIFDDCFTSLSVTVYTARKEEDVDQRNVVCAIILVDAAGEYIKTKRLDEWFRKMNLSRQFLAKEIQSAFDDLVELQRSGWIRGEDLGNHERLIQLYLKLDSDEKKNLDVEKC